MTKNKYEYKVLHIDGCSNGFDQEEYLNKKGKDGWKLVSVVATTNGKPILYLKRELKEKKKNYGAYKRVEKSKPIKEYERLSKDYIQTRMTEIIVDKLGCEEIDVKPKAGFQDDLGADSLDAVELLMEFEKEFNTAIPDEAAEKVRTVGDAVDLMYELINKR